MRMNEGVEWALHSCVNLGWIDDDRAVAVARLAAFYDLPAPYLNKQLQALVRVGILSSTSGPKGGFRLARAPENITLLDIVTAIEGYDDAFRCTQILRNGPGGSADVDYRSHCVLSMAMSKAELAWKRELAAWSVADIAAAVAATTPEVPERTRRKLTE